MAELNLIPYGLKKNRNRMFGSGSGIIILALVAVVAVVAVALPLILKQRLVSEENRLKDEVQKGAAILKESEDLKKTIDSYSQHITRVDAIVKLSPRIEPRVRGLEKHIVGDIAFESLTASFGNSIILTAIAKDYNSIAVFAANLQESKEYASAKITNISYNKEKANYTFSITIPY